MDVRVFPLEGAPADRRRMELVERKEMRHPDSICDGIADAFARRLYRYYLDAGAEVA